MKQRIIFPLTILIIVVAALWALRSISSRYNTVSDSSYANRDVPESNLPIRGPGNGEQPVAPNNTAPGQAPTATLLLKVPFTAQAPTGNWDELHNEACEEASALMADAYFRGNRDATIPASVAEAEISKLTEWQKKNLGYYLSITTAETERMIKEVYGLNTKILENYSEDDFKRELTEGHLIIFPANGRLLHNPNFRAPGPVYHMLVIKGYDRNGFITNDPGTRKGQNYPYSYATLYDAGGDYSHESKVVHPSPKLAIAVWK